MTILNINGSILMKTFIRTRFYSFRHAFVGLIYVIHTQKNAWIHTVASFCVILLAFWLHVTTQDWAILILTLSAVWTAEFINTSLEAVVDLTSPQKHPLAKVGKDVGAAAVLISALSSIVIGFLILGPPLWNRLLQIILSH
jgi:diacylglycerol kinase